MKKEYKLDFIASFILLLVAGIFAWKFVDFNIPPFEDSAMLMRYAEHLSEGRGIVWNVGEHPIDGATDFLFMVVVAFEHFLGLSLEFATRFTSVLSHCLTIVVLYFGLRRIQSANVVLSFCTALYFVIGPGLFLSAAYFGTPFFSLFIAISWILGQTVFFRWSSSQTSRNLVFSSLPLKRINSSGRGFDQLLHANRDRRCRPIQIFHETLHHFYNHLCRSRRNLFFLEMALLWISVTKPLL